MNFSALRSLDVISSIFLLRNEQATSFIHSAADITSQTADRQLLCSSTRPLIDQTETLVLYNVGLLCSPAHRTGFRCNCDTWLGLSDSFTIHHSDVVLRGCRKLLTGIVAPVSYALYRDLKCWQFPSTLLEFRRNKNACILQITNYFAHKICRSSAWRGDYTESRKSRSD